MDQIDNLILRVQGEQELKRLNDLLKEETETLNRWVAQQQQGGQIVGQALQGQARAVLALEKQIEALEKATPGLIGSRGHGLLQLQYVLDDLTNTSGDWTRKLASISNNIPGLIAGLGGGAGVAGAVGLVATGLIALTPLIKSAWGALSEDGPEQAAEKLKTLQAEIAKTHEAFLKLTQTPTNFEKESARQITEFLGERPNAARAKEAVALGMLPDEAEIAITPDERAQMLTDQQIETQAAREGVDSQGDTVPFLERRARERLMKERDAIHRGLMIQARRRRAETVVTGAMKAGPEGEADRRELMNVTQGKAGFEALQGMTPEGIEKQEAEGDDYYQAAVDEGKRLHELGVRDRATAKRRKERQRAAQRQKAQEDHEGLANLDAEDREQEHAQRAEEQRVDRALRRSAQEAKEMPHKQAEQAVTKLSEQIGRQTNGLLGGTPTADQANQMADQVLANMREGSSGQAAVLQAVMGKLQQIIIHQQRENADMRRQITAMGQLFGGGGPDNAQYSHMPLIF